MKKSILYILMLNVHFITPSKKLQTPTSTALALLKNPELLRKSEQTRRRKQQLQVLKEIQQAIHTPTRTSNNKNMTTK